ncbi:hypothetical protein SCHPADRAFT_753361 [Schizopora paradoxa]|uniref:Uncharacterized protein n=1 Tax=Schizopora paradoxa TaxID=27342 RepID=A0A0H2QY50_9AGAM|nr:hypothetical protein SCHPADRAFT_753361 [Schizopora paradoxa]
MARSDAFRSRSPPFHSLNALTHATRPSPIAPSALHPTRQHLSIPPSSRLPAPTPSASSLRVPESSSTRRQTAMPSSTRYQMLSRPEGAVATQTTLGLWQFACASSNSKRDARQLHELNVEGDSATDGEER